MAIFHAPGRANLIGEHTDHTGGLVLPAAIDRYVVLEVEFGGDRIELTSDGGAGTVSLPADGSIIPRQGWGRFVGAVAAELAAIGRDPVGLHGRLTSELPQGAGLSSSAALEVVVALSLCAAAGFALSPMDVAAMCRRAEHRAVGVPSGLMDQAACLLGRADCALLLDCGTLEHRMVPLPADHLLLVIDSGVQRKLESSGYALRTRELAAALPVLAGRRPSEVDPDELDDLLAGLEDVPARRLRHVVTENARVLATEQALLAGDLDEIGRLFDAGHASLRDDFEVTVPELDTLVELAREAGATAARMTGGGFGGAIIVLTPDRRTGVIADEIVGRYASVHAGRMATAHPCRAADGARRLA